MFLNQVIANTNLLAQDYGMAIGIVLLCLFLGLLVIAMPRPRKKYLTATESRDARMKKVDRKRPAGPAKK